MKLRWLHKYEGHPQDDYVMILQYSIVDSSGHWSKWKDVPVVREE